jgi:hypothetical protein
MSSSGKRIDRLLPGLSARERAVVVVTQVRGHTGVMPPIYAR